MEKKNLLIVLSGPSGVGKGTVLKELFKMSDSYVLSVSETTRSPREGEIPGVSYVYVTKEQFEENIQKGLFLEHANFCGNYYGSRRDKVEEHLKTKNVILEIEVDGAMQIKANYPEAVLIQLLPPDYKTLERRLRNRATEKESDIEKRLQRAKKELEFYEKYDYVILNEDGKAAEAALEILNITKTESMRPFRRMEVKEHYYD